MLSAQLPLVMWPSENAPQTPWREGHGRNVAKRAWNIEFFCYYWILTCVPKLLIKRRDQLGHTNRVRRDVVMLTDYSKNNSYLSVQKTWPTDIDLQYLYSSDHRATSKLCSPARQSNLISVGKGSRTVDLDKISDKRTFEG